MGKIEVKKVILIIAITCIIILFGTIIRLLLKIAKGETVLGIYSPTETNLPIYISVGLVSFVILELLVIIIMSVISSIRFNKLKTKSLIKDITKPKLEEPAFIEEVLTDNAIEIKNFSVIYGKTPILRNINLKIKRNLLTCIIGPAGSGKSTILECVVGRKKPRTGEIKMFGIKRSKIKDKMAFVPQFPELYMNQTVYQNMKNSAIRWSVKESNPKIEKVLERFNLLNRKNVKGNRLSGGQIRLLSIAMELIRDPEIIILDEPTTGLDPNKRNEIMTALSNLVYYNKKTVVMTTHHMSDTEEADNIILVGKTKILAQGKANQFKYSLPGKGSSIKILIKNMSYELLNKIKKLKQVDYVIREGKEVTIISKRPEIKLFRNLINKLGGKIVNIRLVPITMIEAFSYFTGGKFW